MISKFIYGYEYQRVKKWFWIQEGKGDEKMFAPKEGTENGINPSHMLLKHKMTGNQPFYFHGCPMPVLSFFIFCFWVLLTHVYILGFGFGFFFLFLFPLTLYNKSNRLVQKYFAGYVRRKCHVVLSF